MKRIVLAILIFIFIFPYTASAYWIDYHVSNNRHWHELRLGYLFGGYWEEGTGNTWETPYWSFRVMPDENDLPDALIPVSLTHHTTTYIDTYYSGFKDFDFQISEPWYQDPIMQTVSVPVGTTIGGGYPGDHLYPYFTEYPEPLDGVEEAYGRVEVGVSWNTHFKIVDAAPPNPIPEPATVTLFGVGLMGIAGIVRRKIFKK